MNPFYQPIFNFLSFFVKKFGDLGIAILFLTIFVRIIFFPINFLLLKQEEKTREIQEKISKIKPQKRLKVLFELYKKEKINPFLGMLIFLIQLPIFLSIYQILQNPSSFPSFYFLKTFDLSKPNLIFPFLTLFFLVLPSFKRKTGEKFFIFFFSFFLFLILLSLPSAISLYLLFNIFLNLIEKALVLKKI